MEKITLLDTAVGSTNRGDEIIMKCACEELEYILRKYYTLPIPTHLCAFNVAECIGPLPDTAAEVASSKYKFVCGTNLLGGKMLNRTNQWDIHLFNSRPLTNAVLVGVGAEEERADFYTTRLYKKILSREYIHSVRNQKAYDMLTAIGLRCLNTGCLTMWKLTPDFCRTIPKKKSKAVIFTLTDYRRSPQDDALLIDILRTNYEKVYFWIQGIYDLDYLSSITDISDIVIVQSDLNAYAQVLDREDIDYVGTRLHAGIFSLRHGVRSIILTVDLRMDSMSSCLPNNCLTRAELEEGLERKIHGELETVCRIDWDAVTRWKVQFS